jgi:hypothetical protein
MAGTSPAITTFVSAFAMKAFSSIAFASIIVHIVANIDDRSTGAAVIATYVPAVKRQDAASQKAGPSPF